VTRVGLTDASRKVQNAPNLRKKQGRVLMNSWPRHKREGATKDQSNQPNGAKGVKAPPRHKGIHHQRGNFSQYPFVGSVMPSSWYYLCYYPPVDYSNMYFFAGIVICI
jgi:hypothetical protein